MYFRIPTFLSVFDLCLFFVFQLAVHYFLNQGCNPFWKKETAHYLLQHLSKRHNPFWKKRETPHYPLRHQVLAPWPPFRYESKASGRFVEPLTKSKSSSTTFNGWYHGTLLLLLLLPNFIKRIDLALFPLYSRPFPWIHSDKRRWFVSRNECISQMNVLASFLAALSNPCWCQWATEEEGRCGNWNVHLLFFVILALLVWRRSKLDTNLHSTLWLCRSVHRGRI